MAEVCGKLVARLRLPKLSADLPGLRYVGDGAPQREKQIEITENGTYEVPADPGTSLTKVTAVVDVNVLEYAKWTNNLFLQAVFPPNTKLHLRLPYVLRTDAMFQGAKGLTEVTLDIPKMDEPIILGRIFQVCREIEVINWNVFRSFREPQQSFYGCDNLRRINGVLDYSAATNYMDMTFGGDRKLEHVRIVPGTIHATIGLSDGWSFSAETIQSFIDGLADLSGAAAQTITFSKKNAITEVQRAQITAKNWNFVQR